MGTRRTDRNEPKTTAKARPKIDRGSPADTGRPKVEPTSRKPGQQVQADETALKDYQQLFRELIARANQGERLAIDRLKQFLDLNPHIWQKAGDLTAVAERGWVELIAGHDEFKTEAVKRRLAELKDQLKGPSPTALEGVLVDLLGIAWLGTQHAEIQAASAAGGSLAQAAFRLKRAESSQKRLLAATKTLATLRALVPRGLVPSQPVRLFDPGSKLG